MPGDRLRLFVGVSIPRGLLEAVERAALPLRDSLPGGRWTTIDNQHVTLKFLGSTPTEQLGSVEAACASVAASHLPASVALTGIGAFPARTRVRVVWVGIDDPGGVLTQIAAHLDAALGPFGFAPDKRAFTPHLTLCRFKTPVRLSAGLPDIVLGTDPFEISSIELLRSHLSPKGARYEVLRTFDLRGS